MKILQFTLPVAHDRAIIVQEDIMPYFYPHLHRHKEAQLIWIKEGEGTLVVDNHLHSFHAGDIYLIGADQPHLFKSNAAYFEPENNLKIEVLMIFFNPKGKLQPFFALPEMHSISNFLNQHQSGFKVPSFDQKATLTAMQLVQKSHDHDLIINFLKLLGGLQKINSELTPLAPVRTAYFSEHEGLRIGNVIDYTMQHYGRNITLEEIAAQVHLTTPAFCRYFKKHTRQTFISFLHEIRINEACKKLTSGKYESIGTVAYTCGFNNVTNFNRVFKSVMKQTPKTYLDNFFNVSKGVI
jgi:AraC-like DNA-binding protein